MNYLLFSPNVLAWVPPALGSPVYQEGPREGTRDPPLRSDLRCFLMGNFKATGELQLLYLNLPQVRGGPQAFTPVSLLANISGLFPEKHIGNQNGMVQQPVLALVKAEEQQFSS